MEIEGRHGVTVVPRFVAAIIRYKPQRPGAHINIKGGLPAVVVLGGIGFAVNGLRPLAGEITRHLRSFEHFFDT